MKFPQTTTIGQTMAFLCTNFGLFFLISHCEQNNNSNMNMTTTTTTTTSSPSSMPSLRLEDNPDLGYLIGLTLAKAQTSTLEDCTTKSRT
jgi:hypothetical protein